MSKELVWAEINLAALEHNFQQLASKVQNNAKICAIVKANAYGHGVIEVVKTVLKAGADYLAVARIDEAIQIRQAGFRVPILILGYTPLERINDLLEYDIDQTAYALDYIETINKMAHDKAVTAKIHLKIDTGMGRLGVAPETAGVFAEAVKKLSNIKIEGVFSHFAKADAVDKSYAKRQLKLFKIALDQIVAQGIEIPLQHMANSAAVLELPESHFNMVRFGVSLYGLWPSAEVKQELDLNPVMTLKARITHVKQMLPNQYISYGCTFQTTVKSIIATLPIGYADGWSRMLSGKVQVLLQDQKVPVVGRICMDQCMIDVTKITDAKVGDEVILFGDKKQLADDIAEVLGTINYEIVCMVSNRVPRIYLRR